MYIENVFTQCLHRRIGSPYYWAKEFEWPEGNKPIFGGDCSGYGTMAFTETDEAALVLGVGGLPYKNGDRWYTSASQYHRNTAESFRRLIDIPLTPAGPFKVGDLCIHRPQGHDACHIGYLCHKDQDGAWWTCEERNGAEHMKLNSPGGFLHRYPAGDLVLGRLSWIDMSKPIPAMPQLTLPAYNHLQYGSKGSQVEAMKKDLNLILAHSQKTGEAGVYAANASKLTSNNPNFLANTKTNILWFQVDPTHLDERGLPLQVDGVVSDHTVYAIGYTKHRLGI